MLGFRHGRLRLFNRMLWNKTVILNKVSIGNTVFDKKLTSTITFEHEGL